MIDIEKILNLRKGEIHIIRVDDIKDVGRMDQIQEEIELICGEEGFEIPKILFISKYESIENLNETDLNSFGWYRRGANITEEKIINRSNIF